MNFTFLNTFCYSVKIITKSRGDYFLPKLVSIKDYWENQQQYCNMVRSIALSRTCFKIPYAFIKTYGCQQNSYDGEKLTGILSEMGYKITDDENHADVIIFNTCAVRGHAEDRVFGNIGNIKKIKEKRPYTIVAICGCMTEQEWVVDKLLKSYPYINLIFGTHSIHQLPKLIYRALVEGKRIVEVDNKDENIYENLPVLRKARIKAFLPVMYGCDNFCSYCVVPYARGRERSRKIDDIVKEASLLLQNGYKDITLLGQNVNSYGKGLEGNINFPVLLKELDSLGGEYRIRFMTSHPKDAKQELIDTISRSKHICTNLHLPFQSGSNRILKAMNRKYTREDYLNKVNYAKTMIDGLQLTSDVIVGFPGETYSEFKETISLIEDVRFTSLYTFIYSKREGTAAARLKDNFKYKEKSQRLTELLKVQEEISSEICKSMTGKVFEVLVEDMSLEGVLVSRTSGNIVTEIRGSNELIGKFINVYIEGSKGKVLKGKII